MGKQVFKGVLDLKPSLGPGADTSFCKRIGVPAVPSSSRRTRCLPLRWDSSSPTILYCNQGLLLQSSSQRIKPKNQISSGLWPSYTQNSI